MLVQIDAHKVEANAMLLCLWYEGYFVTKSDNYDDLKCQTVKNYIRRSHECLIVTHPLTEQQSPFRIAIFQT